MIFKLKTDSKLTWSIRLLFYTTLFCFIMLFRGAYLNEQVWSADSFNSTIPAGYILPETEIVQTIRAKEDSSLHKFSLNLATYARPNYNLEKAEIKVIITNTGNNTSREKTVVTGEIIDGGWYEIIFTEPLIVRSDDIIQIKLVGIDTNESNAPTVWLLSDATDIEESIPLATINGTDLPGSLSIKYSYPLIDTVSIVHTVAIMLLILAALSLEINSTFLRNKFTKFLNSNNVLDNCQQNVSRKYLLSSIKIAFSLVILPFASFYILQRFIMGENHSNLWNIFLPAFVFLLINLFLYMFSGNFAVSFSLSNLMFLAIHLINIGKRNVRGDVFLPSDLFAVREAAEFTDMQMLHDIIESKIIVFILFLILVSIIGKRIFPIRIKLQTRAFLVFAAAISTIFITINIFYDADVLNTKFKVQNIRWEQTQNLQVNGFFQIFFMNSDVLFVKKPAGYNKKNVGKLFTEFKTSEASTSGHYSISNHSLPDNVIIIMNESFYDLGEVDSKYSEYDFMPNTRQLMTDNLSGSAIVPAFGGGTCNSEFEILTGYTMAFLPTGSLPYQQYIYKEHPHSLPGILRDLGYRALATHPNDGSFWNRNYVYGKLGFDKFYDISAYSGLELLGGVYTDKAVYDFVLNDLLKTDQNNFVFAVTMQNHIPYSLDRIAHDYKITKEDEISDELKVYLNLMRKSDDDIKYFIDELEKLDKTSVVLFFGDHAPALGADVYDHTNTDNVLNKYSSPYFIYATSNYHGFDSIDNYPQISTNYLGFYLLDLLGVESGAFHNMLSLSMEHDPILSPYVVYDKASHPYLFDYEVMQYYYLFD